MANDSRRGQWSEELCLHATPIKSAPSGVKREHCLFVSPERLRLERVLPGSLSEVWCSLKDDLVAEPTEQRSGTKWTCLAVGRVWPRQKLDKFDLQATHEIFFLIKNVLRKTERLSGLKVPGFHLLTTKTPSTPVLASAVQCCRPCSTVTGEISSGSSPVDDPNALIRLRNMLDGLIVKDGMLACTGKGEMYQLDLEAAQSPYKMVQWGKTLFRCNSLESRKEDVKVDTGTWNNIGGLQTQWERITDLLSCSMVRMKRERFSKTDLVPPQGIILHGSPGTGKTTLARNISKSLNTLMLDISPASVLGLADEQRQQKVTETFRRAWELSMGDADDGDGKPLIILIDEIDVLFPGKVSNQLSSELNNTFKHCMDKLQDAKYNSLRKGHKFPPIVVIGTTNRYDSVDSSIRQYGRLAHEIEIPVPSALARFEIIKSVLAREHIPSEVTDKELAQVVDRAHGFVGADIYSLCRIATELAVQRCVHNDISPECSFVALKDLQCAISHVQPSAVREITLSVPSTRWKDIGGQDNVKQALVEALEWPLKYPDLFRCFKITPPRGVLLYGPPGCSKTMTARALACESGMNFISIKGPEILGMYVGDSEKAIASVFKKAREAAPCVVFLDEIDSIAKQRSHAGEGNNVLDRVVTQLLQEMDGIPNDFKRSDDSNRGEDATVSSSKDQEIKTLAESEMFRKNVFVIAATNRPDLVDPALLRPGRFDQNIYVGPPDNEARRAIFFERFEKLKSKNSLASDVNLEELVNETWGCSGAECVSILQEAGLRALRESLQRSGTSYIQEHELYVRQRHLVDAARSITRQITPELLRFYSDFKGGNS